MNEFLTNSVYLGVTVSVLAYIIGVFLKKKTNSPFCNPLLISIILTILFLLIVKIDYNTYYNGAKYISYLLTPATICLAVPLYEKLNLLKKNFRAVMLGIISGVITSLTSILAMAAIFRLSHEEYITFLPKSITTAIGIGVSEELGGYISITAAVIIVTGVFGNVIADIVFRIFRIEEPIAKGVALGTAAHAIGTSKAMELGETEGAMSSLSIVVSGLLTVIAASFFAQFI